MLAIDLGGIDILKNKKKSNGDFNFEKGRQNIVYLSLLIVIELSMQVGPSYSFNAEKRMEGPLYLLGYRIILLTK